jgi:16S rRNA processing protein RimM
VRGNLVLQLDVDDPTRYAKIKAVHLMVNGLLVSHEVDACSLAGKTAIIHLREFSTVEQAEPYINHDVYLPISSLPKLKGTKLYFHEAVGMMVTDRTEGSLGTISKILDMPEQPVAVVDFGGKELLFPFLTQFIIEVDRQQKTMLVDLPAGLVDIYREL